MYRRLNSFTKYNKKYTNRKYYPQYNNYQRVQYNPQLEYEDYAFDMMSHSIESMFAAFKCFGVWMGWLDRLSRNIYITNKGMVKVARYFMKVYNSKKIGLLGYPWKNCLYNKEFFLLNKLETYNYLGWYIFYNSTNTDLIKLYNNYTTQLLNNTNQQEARILPNISLEESTLRACMTWLFKNMNILDNDVVLQTAGQPDILSTNKKDKVYHVNPFVIKILLEGEYTRCFGDMFGSVFYHNFLKDTQRLMALQHGNAGRLDSSKLAVKFNEFRRRLILRNTQSRWTDDDTRGWNIGNNEFIENQIQNEPVVQFDYGTPLTLPV